MAYNSGLNGIITKKWRGSVSLSGENKGILGKINGSLRNRREETVKGRGVWHAAANDVTELDTSY